MFRQNIRTIANLSKQKTAIELFQKSCYNKVDFTIHQDKSIFDFVTQLSLFNVGCLAVTNDNNDFVGVCSERDFVNQVVASANKIDKIKVKDICTFTPKVIAAHPNDPLDICMSKMLFCDIRHLTIMNEDKNKCIGMISMRDLVKETLADKNNTITRLSDFTIGKGAFFSSE